MDRPYLGSSTGFGPRKVIDIASELLGATDSTGDLVPLASLAARVMLGETLESLGFVEEIAPPYVCVKEAVFPFSKFPGTDPVLGPEMRSTGEVMGIADSFGSAFAKSQIAASNGLPLSGTVLITVNDPDKPTVTPIARRFHEMGFEILATSGTSRYLRGRGVPSRPVLISHDVAYAGEDGRQGADADQGGQQGLDAGQDQQQHGPHAAQGLGYGRPVRPGGVPPAGPSG
jgi:hypothetical protein